MNPDPRVGKVAAALFDFERTHESGKRGETVRQATAVLAALDAYMDSKLDAMVDALSIPLSAWGPCPPKRAREMAEESLVRALRVVREGGNE